MVDISDVCKISEYGEGDRPQLDKFFKDVWMPPPLKKSSQWFDWKFKKDPNINSSSPALLLAHLDGKIVGMHAITPTPLWVNGNVYEVGWGRDTFVDPTCRRHKIGLLLFDYWGRTYKAILGSGQSESMRNLQLKYGWSQVAKVNQFEKLMFDKDILRNSIADGLVKLSKRFLAMLYAKLKSSNFDIEGRITHNDNFDPKVEKLWEDCRQEYGCICTRDIRTLLWRFIEHPYFSYTVTELVGVNGGYNGYLVTRQEGRTCWLIDMLTRKDDHRARLALIRAAEVFHRNHGVNRFISRTVCVPIESALKEMGYLSTAFEQFFCMKTSIDFIPRAQNQWYVTSMDSDLDR